MAHRLERCHPVALVGRAAEVEPVKVERFGDLALHESFERLTRHPAHDFAYQPAVREGVVSVPCTRLIRRGRLS